MGMELLTGAQRDEIAPLLAVDEENPQAIETRPSQNSDRMAPRLKSEGAFRGMKRP